MLIASTGKVHTTVGIYPNREFKVNGVCPNDLEAHIKFNKENRPGRALMVDGKIVHTGYFSDKDIPDLEKEFADCERCMCTSPYS